MQGELTHPAHDRQSAKAMADAELVIRARDDRAAFGPLYDRYFGPIFRFCFYRVGDWQEAEDSAADIFINALASLERFRDGDRPDGFRCWLFVIARNTVANRRRNRRHDAPLEAAECIADVAPTPEETALVNDQHQFVLKLLAQLKPDQRDLLELRLAGLNDAEIARVLGRNHDAVRKEQSRAILQLRGMVNAREERGPRHE
jgi:RNA polymerase sigma-70 factor (ECF subfamily)